MFKWLKFKLRSQVPPSRSQLQMAEDAFQHGRLGQAREHAVALLENSPNHVGALSLLAAISADERKIEEGLRWAEAAIAGHPMAEAAHYAAGRLWDLAGESDKAEASYRRVIEIDPGHARAHNNLGRVLNLKGDFAGAVSCYQEALRFDPLQPEANQNYATLTSSADAREAAINGYRLQTRVNPKDARAFTNLSNILCGSGRYAEALESVERALAIDPEHAESHYARALLLLTLGDYAAGWVEYEWRLRMKSVFSDPSRRFPMPLWDGRRMEGGSILLHGELAYGESLQFVRYARLVADRCGAVLFECMPPLKSLLARVDGVTRAVAPEEALPPFDTHALISSLPRIFGTTLQNIPWSGPYIEADRNRVAAWRRVVDAEAPGQFKVGLVWSGNPKAANNRDRSLKFEMLAPLREIPGTALYSLQKDAPHFGEQATRAFRIFDHTKRLVDFSDTAALIRCLDLVITVDTAVAHLAGAMGAPVWVLLNRTADWRYHLERSDNPWYPGMRLFRQVREGEWAGVIENVAHALRGESSRHKQRQGE